MKSGAQFEDRLGFYPYGARKPRPADRSAVFALATGPCRVDSISLAYSVWRRFWGLMGRPPPGNGRGLFLAPCASIHTLFMRFDLDLIFVSRDLRVVRVVTSVKPWRMALGGKSAWGVLELQAGWFPCDRLAPGTLMQWEPPRPGAT